MIQFLGCRGTIPVFGPDVSRFAGSTPCLFVPAADDRCIIVDGGTGIFSMNQHSEFNEFHLFFTHLHWDHIMGLPMFKFFYQANKKIIIYVQRKKSFDSSNFLDVLFNPPFFPVPRKKLMADIEIRLLDGGETFQLDSITIDNIEGNHPDRSLIYKINDQKNSLVFATDFEHGTEKDDELADFARGSDYLVYDTCYFPDDYVGDRDGVAKVGYGHSTYVEGCKIAKIAGVKNFMLYHYSPDYSDEDILEMERLSKKMFVNSYMSYDNLILK